MFGYNKKYPNSPLRSPNISTNKKSGFRTIGSKKLSKKYREKLEEAINMTSCQIQLKKIFVIIKILIMLFLLMKKIKKYTNLDYG